MICAPVRRTSFALRPRTTAWVPTGMNAGVSTFPWGNVNTPARADPCVRCSSKVNIKPEGSCCGADRRQNPIDLTAMHQVVSRHEAKQKARGFGAAFTVEPNSLQLARRELAENMDVGCPETAQLVHGKFELHVAVCEDPNPGILIIGLNGRPVLSQDHPQAEAEYEIRI